MLSVQVLCSSFNLVLTSKRSFSTRSMRPASTSRLRHVLRALFDGFVRVMGRIRWKVSRIFSWKAERE